LCAKAGFTFLVGGDMERRRLAGMKPTSLSHHQKIKKLSHSSTEDALFTNMVNGIDFTKF
jgi:hypothetical protein